MTETIALFALINNFSEVHAYDGPEEISMVIWFQFIISVVELITSETRFLLSNALCAPDIKQNLLFIS